MKQLCRVRDFDLRIAERNLGDLFREPNKPEMSSLLAEKVNHWLEQLPGYLDPCLCYVLEDIQEVSAGAVQLQSGACLKSLKLSKALEGSDRVVCFIGTIGGALEQQIGRFTTDGLHADAFILDAMGSFAVENMVEQFNRRIAELYLEQGMAVTLRFSPGYCDWPVAEQRKLFSLFEGEQIDVELTGSFLMRPRKSISGIFGLLDSAIAQSGIPYNPCENCGKHDCSHRRR